MQQSDRCGSLTGAGGNVPPVPTTPEPEPAAPRTVTGPLVEHSVTLPVPPTTVWALLTSGEGLATWYAIGGGASVSAEVGGQISLWWQQDQVFTGPIEVCRPPARFDYRIPQEPGGSVAAEDTTLVQFKVDPVEDDPGRATVTVRESGFTQLEQPREAFTASSVAWIGAFGLLQQVADRLATMTE